MSFYYEQRGCCGKKKVEAAEDRHEKDCFCGKFLKRFLGQEVEIFLRGSEESVEGRILCIDKDTGIVTVAGLADDVLADPPVTLAVDYICCKEITRIRPLV